MKQGTFFTASVYIVFQDKVLVHRHKKFDLIIPVGGYLEGSELPEQAVVREAKEETGLDIILYNPYPTDLDDDKWRQANGGMCLAAIESKPGIVQYDFTFFAQVDDISLLGAGELDEDSFLLLTKEEIDGLDGAAVNVKYYAKKALETCGDLGV